MLKDAGWFPTMYVLNILRLAQSRLVSMNSPLHTSLFCSPIKFSSADCWSRGSGMEPPRGRGSSDYPMDVGMEQMDVTVSGEASAPLPIRNPMGVSSVPFKKQTYPVPPNRPAHLRMNL